MYVKLYKARSYSYIDKNFETLEDAKEFLNANEQPLAFHTNPYSHELCAEYDGWEIILKEGNMPDKGEGYVDMTEESGVLEDCY